MTVLGLSQSLDTELGCATPPALLKEKEHVERSWCALLLSSPVFVSSLR
jgi:hypothetical protein